MNPRSPLAFTRAAVVAVACVGACGGESLRTVGDQPAPSGTTAETGGTGSATPGSPKPNSPAASASGGATNAGGQPTMSGNGVASAGHGALGNGGSATATGGASTDPNGSDPGARGGQGTGGGLGVGGSFVAGGSTGVSTSGGAPSTTGGASGTSGAAGMPSGGSGGAVEPPIVAEPPPATWDTLKLVLTGTSPPCTGAACHSGAGSKVHLGLPVKNDAQLYKVLTEYVSEDCGNLPMVTPGYPEDSALVMVLKGPCSEDVPRMPNGCDDEQGNCVPDEYIAAIERWIAEGAQHP